MKTALSGFTPRPRLPDSNDPIKRGIHEPTRTSEICRNRRRCQALPLPLLAQQQRAICYNCPPEWADWGGMLKLINQKLSISVPPDNKNSGQSLAALIAEKGNPVADVTYLGGQVGPQAREAGVLTPYKPQRWNDIPTGLKDPEGYWFTIIRERSVSSSIPRRCAASRCHVRGRT